MGCMIPQPFTARGNPPYPEFWTITGGPQYSGYYTPIVTPEPSVEWVARVGHSMIGKIGTHMLLWVPSWDLVVRPWG
jgi:hypothetical protein